MLSFVLSAPLAFAAAPPTDPLPVPVARIEAPYGSGLGTAFDIDGDWLAAASADFGGPVFLYRRSPVNGNDWFLAQILSPGGSTDSVALDGTTLLVGLSNEAEVEVYELESQRWHLVQTLTSTYYGFGETLALDGDTMAVGAGFHFCYLGAFDESVHVFERTPGVPASWTSSAVLTPPGSSGIETSFGQSIAVHDDLVIASEPVISGLCTGRKPAHVYRRDLGGPGNWGEETLLAPPPIGSGSFGEFLDQFGDLALVGDRNDNVAVYDRNAQGPNSWARTATIEVNSGDLVYGGNRLYVSITLNRVSVYERHLGGENAWGLVGELPAPPSQPQTLGTDLVLNHNTNRIELALWANRNNNNPERSIYVYSTPRSVRTMPRLGGPVSR